MAGLLCWRRVERRRLALRRWFNTISPDLVGTRFDIDASGILCGGQAGFDYQTGSWVIGIEGSGGRRRPRIAAEGVPSSQAPTTTRRMSICRPPSPDASVTHETSGLLRKSRLGRRRISSSLCSTMGRRCVPTRATGPIAGRSAAEENMPFARTFRSASSTTRSSSIKMVGGLNKDGWRISCPTSLSGVGGGVPVVDGDLNVRWRF